MIVNSAIVFMSSILLSVSPRAFGSCRRSLGVRLMKKPGEPRQHPRGTSGPERQAEDGGGRRFCRARNSAVRPKGKIVDHEPLRRGSAGLKPPMTEVPYGHERGHPCVSLASSGLCVFFSLSPAFSQHLVLRLILCCACFEPPLIVHGLFGWRPPCVTRRCPWAAM